MAGLCEICSHVAAILFYLESASRVTTTCTQTDCTWKQPRLVDYINGLIFSYWSLKKEIVDTVPLSDLPMHPETLVELAPGTVELDSNGIDTASSFSKTVGPESSQCELQLLQVPQTS